MRFSIASITLATYAVVSAQEVGQLPKCAQTCVGTSLASGTGCKTADIACICNSKDWIAGLSCCVSKSCNSADQAATIKYAQDICATYQITLPSVAGCANSTTNSTVNTTSTTGTSTSASASSTSAGAVSTSKTGGAPAAFTQYVGSGLALAAAGLLGAVL